MLQLRKTKKVFANFPQSFWCFPTKFQRFKKIVLSSSRGQGNFRGPKASRPRPRTWGFEAKAKDLKMCPRGRPRGQGRPRGLHLCNSLLLGPEFLWHFETNWPSNSTANEQICLETLFPKNKRHL